MVQIEAIVFDVDGTLVDTANFKNPNSGPGRLKKIIESLGYPIPDNINQRIKDCWAYGDLDNQIVQGPFGVPIEAAKLALEMWKEWDEREPCELLPGVERIPRMLQNAGFVTAILTSRGHQSLSAMLHYHQIQWHFHKVFSRERCFYKKPHRRAADELFDELGRAFGIKPENSAYLGDIPRDMRFAVGAGMIPLGTPTGLYSKEDLLAATDEEGNLLNIPKENIVGSVADLEHWLRTYGHL